MDGLRILSGSQLVAKGATKKVDGQLPEVGLKDVTPNGTWLEQKQIQSALEARKNLIAVERIEKSGSLSHAVWRDDLKLAEVTKQTGGYWQYMGHRRGKYLYLLPEETLFLIESNSLLLKHNDVTVSLQKAYSVCLSEMSIVQYKVYASLSRLGYRVFKHKEPTDKTNEQKANIETDTAMEEYPEICQTVCMNNKHVDGNDMEMAENVSETVEKDPETNTNDLKTAENDPVTVEIDAEIVENDPESVKNDPEVIKNDPGSVANDPENITNTPVKDIPENDRGVTKEDIILSANDSATIQENNIDTDSTVININSASINDKASEIEKTVPKTEVTGNINESNTSEGIMVTIMDIDDHNVNESIVTNDNNARKDASQGIANVIMANITTTSQDKMPVETVISETSNTISVAAVYSVDELGVIRIFERDTPMEIDSGDSVVNIAAVSTDNPETKDPGANESYKHYQLEMKYYDNKIKKLIERKPNPDQRNSQGLNTMQDFYKKHMVKVNVPDEKYLPRNIFLHKTEYTLDMEVVRTQNASNVSDETDSVGSSTTPAHGTNSQRLTELPRYGTFNFNNMPPRYPTFQPQRPFYNSRLNYNNYMFRTYGHPRFNPNYARQHYMMYNVNMPLMNHIYNARHARNQTDRRDTVKKYHYDMIVNIAMRLKNGLGLPSQVRALQNLLHTYNCRYNTHIRMTPDFNIIGTPDTVVDEKVIELDDEKVISLDDEPKSKKRRLNDDNIKYNSNLVKLKELAAKLKELHAKHLAVSRHRRVFSNAIKTFNKSFNADLYLDSNFEIIDRKTVVVDTSSDSEAVVVNEKGKPKKRKKLRNPYSILKRMANDVNVGASTSVQVPVLRKLSLNVINDGTSQNTKSDNAILASTVDDDKNANLLKCFYKARFTGDDDFGGAELCSRLNARLDALLMQAEYLHEVLKESLTEFDSWVDIKLAILKDIRGSLNLQKQQVEALSNDFFTTESQIRPILGPDCTDLKSALKKLAIIPSNKEIPAETCLRIHFDVCNRDVQFKKSNPPKPNFRVICYDESAPFPSTEDVVALQAKYSDGVPTAFAFVGVSASISYLQINSIELPVFIPDNDLA